MLILLWALLRRWWEARKMWGQLLNITRNLVRQVGPPTRHFAAGSCLSFARVITPSLLSKTPNIMGSSVQVVALDIKHGHLAPVQSVIRSSEPNPVRRTSCKSILLSHNPVQACAHQAICCDKQTVANSV